MNLDFTRFYKACNPSKTLDLRDPQDLEYSIDVSAIRGRYAIANMKRTITCASGDRPTCQLFSAHLGCWKFQELRRLQAELEQEGFYVIYCDVSRDLEMADVEICEILLAIAGQVSESLHQGQIHVEPGQELRKILVGAAKLLEISEIGTAEEEFSLSLEIGKIMAKVKQSGPLRHQLRQYLDPRTNILLDALNREVLAPATQQRDLQGK